MAPSFCAVQGCGNKASKEVLIHRFPNDQHRSILWASFCGHGESWMPKSNQGICSIHFPQSSYDARYSIRHESVGAKMRRQLLPRAIPLLHPARHELSDPVHQMCRLCLSEECLDDIFKENGLQRWIREFLSITISTSDRMSRTICTICRMKLTEFHQFRLRCQEVQTVLQSMGQNDYTGRESEPDQQDSEKLVGSLEHLDNHMDEQNVLVTLRQVKTELFDNAEETTSKVALQDELQDIKYNVESVWADSPQINHNETGMDQSIKAEEMFYIQEVKVEAPSDDDVDIGNDLLNEPSKSLTVRHQPTMKHDTSLQQNDSNELPFKLEDEKNSNGTDVKDCKTDHPCLQDPTLGDKEDYLMSQQTEQLKYSCRICDKKYSMRTRLLNHMYHAHGETVKSNKRKLSSNDSNKNSDLEVTNEDEQSNQSAGKVTPSKKQPRRNTH